ncbi:MAG: hypothetical protein HYV16_02360 [Gammaproteobacteria bacterium]|nr:hypothetical protein [Gammaproteobacteria bacterium]
MFATLVSGMASAAEPRNEPVQEDPILKTVKPKTDQVSERALPTDLPQGVDSRVQEDPLLKSAAEPKPAKSAPAPAEKPSAMPDAAPETKASSAKPELKASVRETPSEKPVEEKPAKKKDSKVQEDPLLQTLEPN